MDSALVQGFGDWFRTVTAELHVKNGGVDPWGRCEHEPAYHTARLTANGVA
jgi:hypothetical protein